MNLQKIYERPLNFEGGGERGGGGHLKKSPFPSELMSFWEVFTQNRTKVSSIGMHTFPLAPPGVRPHLSAFFTFYPKYFSSRQLLDLSRKWRLILPWAEFCIFTQPRFVACLSPCCPSKLKNIYCSTSICCTLFHSYFAQHKHKEILLQIFHKYLEPVWLSSCLADPSL